MDSKPKSHALLAILLINFATLFWAGNMVLGRWMSQFIGPMSLSAARYLIGGAIFAVILFFRPEDRSVGKGGGWWFLGMAVCGIVGFPCLLYFGLRYTTAINATLINGLGPFVTALLSHVLLGEPMTRRQWIGTITAFAGVVFLISGDWLKASSTGFNPGDLLVFGAVVMWGGFSVLSRRVTVHRSVLSASAFATFLGLPILLVLAIWEINYIPIQLSPNMLWGILYIGIFPSVLSLIFWTYGVSRLGSTGAMVFYNTLPFYGVLLSFLLLNESLSFSHVIGGVLIVGGALYSNAKGGS